MGIMPLCTNSRHVVEGNFLHSKRRGAVESAFREPRSTGRDYSHLIEMVLQGNQFMSQETVLARLRADARTIVDACIKAADPEAAVKRFVSREGDDLRVGQDLHIRLSDWDRILLVGAGKASASMAMALEDLLGDLIVDGLISVKYAHSLPLKRVRVLEAGHPLPDLAGEQAALRIVRLLSAAREKDLVISCISGGGSALLPAPADGVTLEDKRALTEMLSAVGADINELNTVRKHVSLTKGGNLMRIAYPAFVVNLLLSDVVGDDPQTIASGPFVPDRSTFAQAMEILDRYGLSKDLPSGIERRIREGISGLVPETPKPGDMIFDRVKNIVIGSNGLSLHAGKTKAEELGYATLILSSSIVGDTTEAAMFHAAVAREVRATGNPVPARACLLSGGETTVRIRGNGLGGRNQEFALALVRDASHIPGCLFLSVGTDGTDGPTDAAGAVVDSLTFDRGMQKGLDPASFLRNNDSHTFFRELDDLIVTGPTRTNVMDVRLVLIA
jgi:glycerate 2-kinase